VHLAPEPGAAPPDERPVTYAEAPGLAEAAEHILALTRDPSF
jgi:hypothetical protein